MDDSALPSIVIDVDKPQAEPARIRRPRTKHGPLWILAAHGALFVAAIVTFVACGDVDPAQTTKGILRYAASWILFQQLTLVVQWMSVGTTQALARSIAGTLLLAVLVGMLSYVSYVNLSGRNREWDFVGHLLTLSLQTFLVAGPLAIARIGGVGLVRIPVKRRQRFGQHGAFRWTLKEALLWVLFLSIATASVRYLLQRDDVALDSGGAINTVAWCAASLSISLAMMLALGAGAPWRRLLTTLGLLLVAQVAVWAVWMLFIYRSVVEASNAVFAWKVVLASLLPYFAIHTVVSVILPIATYLAVRCCGFRWVREEPAIEQGSA